MTGLGHALRVAAEAIRALPDAEIVAMALRAHDADLVAAASLQRHDAALVEEPLLPTAALRAERAGAERDHSNGRDVTASAPRPAAVEVPAAVEPTPPAAAAPPPPAPSPPAEEEAATRTPRPSRRPTGRPPGHPSEHTKERALAALMLRPMTLAELREHLGWESAAMRNAVQRLRMAGLARCTDGVWRATR